MAASIFGATVIFGKSQNPDMNSIASKIFLLFVAMIATEAEPLPGTTPLTMDGDLSAQMVLGIDRFLLRETDLAAQERDARWHRNFSSPEAYNASIEPQRQELRRIIGAVDARVPVKMEELREVNGDKDHSLKNFR